MQTPLIVSTVIALITTITAEQSGYEGYNVYRVQPSKNQMNLLATLRNNIYLDFWSPLRRDGSPCDVMVHPSMQKNFLKFLDSNLIRFEVIIDNVERIAMREQLKQRMVARNDDGKIAFDRYHRHAEINAYLDQLKNDYPIVSTERIGKSYEDRDLKLIKISTNFSANKPVIFIDAGIHAREWIAPAVALYTINQLVENHENIHMLDKVDYHIIPLMNPDGYEYTHEKDRLWRKTRSAGVICNGTDGNRNFDFHWAEIGSSYDECSVAYHGKRPFSELETTAIKDNILANKDRIKLYLTFHSYGQLILYPWGYTSNLPKDSAELQKLGELVAKNISSVSGTNYKVGSSTNVLYEAAGGGDDWVKGVAGIELAYTIELPPTLLEIDGFDPPTERILPITRETFEGIKVFNEYILKKFGENQP